MSDTTTQDALMGLQDLLAQYAEMVAGYRARLEAMGWSPTAAEWCALQVLLAMQAKILGGAA